MAQLLLFLKSGHCQGVYFLTCPPQKGGFLATTGSTLPKLEELRVAAPGLP